MAHRGGKNNNLYSAYRDDDVEIVEEIEPDLSLFQIGMGDSPSYADSYAEEISIEQHHQEVASFKDEASMNTGTEQHQPSRKSRKSRKSSRSTKTLR